MRPTATTTTTNGAVAYLVLGFRPRMYDTIHPTVCIYGLYTTYEDAVGRLRRLCGEVPTEIFGTARGRGHVAWIKDVPFGDVEARSMR